MSLARIGCVPYLNARPLLVGLRGLSLPIRELVPAKLGEAFQAGDFDAALLSSIDVISQENPQAVDGVSISSQGDVHSVVLAYEGDLKRIESVVLDPASHTSNALLRIVLEEFHGILPEYVQSNSVESKNVARLMIGDPALLFRKTALGSEMQFLDLGGEWFRNTGLPFVFAMWSLKYDYMKKKELSEQLRSAKRLGLEHRSAIAALEADPDFSLHYLTELIRYDLEDREKAGLTLFGEFLKKKEITKVNNKIIYY